MRGESYESKIEIEIESTETHLDQIQRLMSVSPWWRETESRVTVTERDRERDKSERVRNPASSETHAGESETHAATPDEIHLLLPLSVAVAWSAQPAQLRAFTVHRYLLLSFPSKPCDLRIKETLLVPCGLVVFHVCVFTNEWRIELIWWLWIESVLWLLPVVFFFFFFFGLFGFVTLCLWLLHYIDKRDR